MQAHRTFRDLDWSLLCVSLLICGLGVLQIYSATNGTKWQGAWWRQIIYILTGLVMMWIVANVDYHSLMGHVYVLYAVSIGLLLITGLVGNRVFGSTRWIKLGSFTLQTSEFVKIVLVLLVARYLADLKFDHIDWPDLLRLGALVAVPFVLVQKQPDLGTALTYLPILAAGVLVAGLRWQHMLAIAVVAAVCLPIGYHFLKPYQKDRLVTFMDPARDPKGSGFQVIQSKIAVGNGGVWGRGVTKGSQTHLGFLPVPHTDFIFSSFAEEHGFLGVVVALVLYLLLIMQVAENAQSAPDRAGVFIAMGIGSLLLFHVLANVGMVVGRMPVVGIPLPLMSYGGSNAWSVFLMLGLINSVRLRRFVNR